jgi:hypothetical protein
MNQNQKTYSWLGEILKKIITPPPKKNKNKKKSDLKSMVVAPFQGNLVYFNVSVHI